MTDTTSASIDHGGLTRVGKVLLGDRMPAGLTSGRYGHRSRAWGGRAPSGPGPGAGSGQTGMSPESDGKHEQIRLDVDGAAPQMTASGAIESGFGRRLQWIASLRPAGPDTWEGPIWFKDGAGELLPQSTVRITATKAVVPNQRRLTAVFYGGGPPPRERVYPSSPVAGIDADGFRTGHIAG